MSSEYRDHTFWDFLSDDAFCRIARRAEAGDRGELDALLREHPHAAHEMRKACALLRAIRPSEPDPAPGQIARSLSDVRRRVARNRRFRFVCRWTAAAAALALVLTGWYELREQELRIEYEIAATLRSGSVPSDSIVVAVGSREVCKLSEASATIDQDAEGLVVNRRQRIETGRFGSQWVHLSVPYGKRSVVELEDGTRIWVGPGSKLVYPARFGSKRREVHADGEVYFEVVHDTRRPFVVKNGKVEVRVLGTRFNLDAGCRNDYAEVVLVEGRVEVTSATGRRETLLPAQRYHETAAGAAVDRVDTAFFTSWKEGYLLLDGGELSELFRKIERYYGVTLEYDDALGRRAYKGKLELCPKVEEVLRNLSMVEPFGFVRTRTENYSLTAKTP